MNRFINNVNGFNSLIDSMSVSTGSTQMIQYIINQWGLFMENKPFNATYHNMKLINCRVLRKDEWLTLKFMLLLPEGG